MSIHHALNQYLLIYSVLDWTDQEQSRSWTCWFSEHCFHLGAARPWPLIDWSFFRFGFHSRPWKHSDVSFVSGSKKEILNLKELSIQLSIILTLLHLHVTKEHSLRYPRYFFLFWSLSHLCKGWLSLPPQVSEFLSLVWRFHNSVPLLGDCIRSEELMPVYCCIAFNEKNVPGNSKFPLTKQCNKLEKLQDLTLLSI